MKGYWYLKVADTNAGTLVLNDYSFPWWNFRSRERTVHGPFVPWTFCSRDCSFSGTNKPWSCPSADHSYPGTFISNYITNCEASVSFVQLHCHKFTLFQVQQKYCISLYSYACKRVCKCVIKHCKMYVLISSHVSYMLLHRGRLNFY